MADRLGKQLEITLRRLVVKFLRGLGRRSGERSGRPDPATAKYLFIRQDMLGDVLVSTALFSVLKSRYPKATLDVVLSPKNQAAVANNENVRIKWIYDKTLKGTAQLIKKLRLERYDFAIDLMDNPSATSTILCLSAGAQWNVGIEKENSYAYDIRVPLLSRRDHHIIDRLGELLRPFGIDPAKVDLRPQYRPSAIAEGFTDEMYAKLGLIGHAVIGVNISAGTDTRFWGIENFRAFLLELAPQLPKVKFLVLYKPSDAPRAQAIGAGTTAIVSGLTPSFDHFAALIRRLSFLLTPDTSAVHLASAFQIPAVVLYVQSNPDLRIWDPYKSPSRTITTPVDDLTTIPVGQVLDATKDLLRKARPEFGVGQ